MSDLISRQAAIDVVRDVCDAIMSCCGSHYDEETDDEVYDDIREIDAILKCNKEMRIALKNMPSAEPERKTGKWIYGEDSIADGVDGYRCDQCGFFVPWDYTHKSIDYIKDYNFCPKCGSYNGGEQDG